jgi:hypothetical protein
MPFGKSMLPFYILPAIAFGPAPLSALPCPDYACDSAAVRVILDANSLEEVAVGQVSARTDGRITSLALEYRHLDTLPPDVGRLSSLRTLRLDRNDLKGLPREIGALHTLEMLLLDNNRLEALPGEIGDLASLTILVAFTNRLDGIPETIGNLVGLKMLRLEDNRLTRLPPTILRLAPTEFFGIEKNWICALSDSIEAWIDAYSAGRDWRATQSQDGATACVSSIRVRRETGAGRVPEAYGGPARNPQLFRFEAGGTKTPRWYDPRGRCLERRMR